MKRREVFDSSAASSAISSGGADPADQWVFDPAIGEYRLRLPVEVLSKPSVVEPADHSAAQATAPSDWYPVDDGRAQAGGVERRRRRGRRNPRPLGTALTTGVLSLLAVVGVAIYLTQQDSDKSGGNAGAVPSASCTAKSQQADRGLPDVLSGARANPIDVRVTVLNGSGTFGQAEAVLRWMQNKEGFLRTSNGGPAPQIAHTLLRYAPNHVDQARTLAAAMGLPASTLQPTAEDSGLRDPMILTLGHDFRGVGLPLAAPSGTVREAASPERRRQCGTS